jgi:hypothetical protein
MGAMGRRLKFRQCRRVRENELARAKKRSAIHWAGLSSAVIAIGLHEPTQQKFRRSAC